MKARRTNPWPAVTDLFAALMVAALAAFVVSNGERVKDQEVIGAVHGIHDQLRKALNIHGQPGALENCDFDTCIPVKVEFDLDKDSLTPDGQQQVDRLCRDYKAQVETLSAKDKVILVIEGHTDPTKPKSANHEANERHNWELSARRATSVLRRFASCGVSNEHGFEVTAAGFADSRDVLAPGAVSESERNQLRRRITLRVRVNQDLVRRQLEAATQ